MIKKIWTAAITLSICVNTAGKIDRQTVVNRHDPMVTSLNPLTALTIGNGGFAFTVDATGLQTFPERYGRGIVLGTMSDWGWHSFPNPDGFTETETLVDYDLGHRQIEPYAVKGKERRQRKAANYFIVNPHRLHLGNVGFDIPLSDTIAITDINQKLNLYNGAIDSRFTYRGRKFHSETVCHPVLDMISVHVTSSDRMLPIVLRFPYPTGAHTDDASRWDADDKHQTEIIGKFAQHALIKRTLDNTTYYINVCWTGKATVSHEGPNRIVLSPASSDFTFSCEFSANNDFSPALDFDNIKIAAAKHWNNYWNRGAIVDFSACKAPRANELERRVVQSQYLLAVQEAGQYPPQETGLTYNSWQGKFHLEMTWWHTAQYALWGHPEILERMMDWYFTVEDKAHEIAHRQGFDGIRWMKTTDPTGIETPSYPGSFLIWQQPHFIYFAELLYRVNPSKAVIEKYNRLVQETAAFMYSFATYDEANDRYVLKGYIPAQEVCEPQEALNSPLELSFWYFGLKTAQQWRERAGQSRKAEWDVMLQKLSRLAADSEGRYIATENAQDTYAEGANDKYINDHPAVLGAVGILPMCPLVDTDKMKHTFNWIWDHWHWETSWGWDYPMAAMNAARVGEPQKAVDALLMEQRKNTYLPQGHNYQNDIWRLYLPGNGGLLTAVAMMCAGWDGTKANNPGFPHNGNWNVRWEGLKPLP